MMIEFTDPEGNPIWIAKSWVQMVRQPIKDEWPAGANATIVISGYKQAIKETVDAAVKAIWNADG